jgi:hypothetical protein
MDKDERWVNRSAQTMLDTFHWFRSEGFDLIVEDLLRLPAETGTIVEGSRLLPRLVKPLLAQPGHAVSLLPTPESRQAAFDSCGQEIPRKTSNPELAQRNLLERDRMFTDRLFGETKPLELPVIEIDTALNESELARQVTQTFEL